MDCTIGHQTELCVERTDYREATHWAQESVQGSRVALVKSLRSADFIGSMLWSERYVRLSISSFGILCIGEEIARIKKRHDGPFRPGCARLYPWYMGRTFGAEPARRSPVSNVPEDRKKGEARIRRGRASQRGHTTQRQRANPFGQDRGHPRTASASGCRWDCSGLAPVRRAPRWGEPMHERS
jgi:hypothetical protein